MVTIEQKLLLFSKLLNQSMNKKFEEEFKEMEKQYKDKIQKIKEEVYNEVRRIEEQAKIGGESRLAQSISKSRVSIKKEIMTLNEKYYKIFMIKLKNILDNFVESEDYRNYLDNIIANYNAEILSCYNIDDIDNIDNIIIYLTKADFDKYGEFIKQEISKKQNTIKIEFHTTDNIIGGLIIVIPKNNFKVTMTIDSVLEENKLYIMQTLFEALEAGVYNG